MDSCSLSARSHQRICVCVHSYSSCTLPVAQNNSWSSLNSYCVPERYDPIFPTEEPYKLCANSIVYVSHKFMYHIFPVVMYGCESWTIKKAECRRIDAFELWCCRRLLRVPWTARRSSQSILKEISPGCSLEGLMLKLKLLLWPPDARRWLIWKDPDAGKDWGQEEKGTTEIEMIGWHHRLNGHEFG